MFPIPEGAKVWALDATPVLELKDGSVVFAARPDIPVPREVFVKAEPADSGDMTYWEKRYADWPVGFMWASLKVACVVKFERSALITLLQDESIGADVVAPIEEFSQHASSGDWL